jgi:hypothetical protein
MLPGSALVMANQGERQASQQAECQGLGDLGG